MYEKKTFKKLSGIESTFASVPQRRSCISPNSDQTQGPNSVFDSVSLPPEGAPMGTFNGEPLVESSRVADTSGSFSEIVKSGDIKMTPMSASSSKTQHFLATYFNRVGVITNGKPRQSGTYGGHPPKHWGCSVYPWLIYQESTICDLEYATEKLKLPMLSKQRHVEVYEQMVINELIEEANSTYDLLTDLAELPSTLRLAFSLINSIRHPLQTYRTFARKYKRMSKAEKAKLAPDILAKKWLEVQYGIMPVYLSIMDILSVIEHSEAKYKTVRKTKVVPTTRVILTGPCLYEVDNRNIIIKGTAKMKFSSQLNRLTSEVGFNPLRTAWDIIPYSLVVDWFIDVSSFFISIPSFVGFGEDSKACVSVKVTGSVDTYIYQPPTTYLLKHPTVPIVELQDCHIGWEPYDHVVQEEPFEQSENHSLIKRIEYNSYTRRLVNSTDTNLVLSPRFSNWKRQLSAVALSWVALPQLLRSLKK